MKKLGLIGFPLKNSFSENYFRDKFSALDIHDIQYRNFPLESIESLPDLLSHNPELFGLNVTIPYKQAVIPFLDALDETASAVSAVNCIRIIRKEQETKPFLIGFNTDIYGFEHSLLPVTRDKHVTKALILGTGGAAKAVEYVMRKLHIDYVSVSRNPNEGQLCYEDLTEEILTTHQLIVNCTPVGMFPDIMKYPAIPYHLLSACHIAYDLIYHPAETEFLRLSRLQGASTKNGLEMLQLQAERAWEIWNPVT